jgi:hypothetical protein
LPAAAGVGGATKTGESMKKTKRILSIKSPFSQKFAGDYHDAKPSKRTSAPLRPFFEITGMP